MIQLTSLTNLHSIPASRGGEYSMGTAGHAGVPELHAGMHTTRGIAQQKFAIKRLGAADSEQPGLVLALREDLERHTGAPHANVVGVVDVTENPPGFGSYWNR